MRRHRDGCQIILSHYVGTWHVTLIVRRRPRGPAVIVGPTNPDLDEGKGLCEKFLQIESSHVCSEECGNWKAVQAYFPFFPSLASSP